MDSLIIVGVIVVILIWGVTLYNNLVRQRQFVREGWSSIDVQLKRRFDLVPNLVESVKAYAAHEKSVFEEVTKARASVAGSASASLADRAAGEDLLSRSLGRLMAVAENYPELRSNENFLALQNELSNLENEIQMARRYYNGAVRNNNTLVESFPAMILARMFNFDIAEYFELSNEGERAVPKVGF